jgi:hypothetical protein
VTWWTLQVLKRSEQVPGRHQAVEKASAWLSQRFTQSETPEYRETASTDRFTPALFWMAQEFNQGNASRYAVTKKADAYADYLRSSVEQPEEWLADLRQQQLADGSWIIEEDRWWKAGGQVYVTALRILAQVPQGA